MRHGWARDVKMILFCMHLNASMIRCVDRRDPDVKAAETNICDAKHSGAMKAPVLNSSKLHSCFGHTAANSKSPHWS